MSHDELSDDAAKEVLRGWPQRPTKWFRTAQTTGFWLRAQPPDGHTAGPKLVMPGATEFATQPDGLWLWFGELDFVDVIAVEVCRGQRDQNLNDKRSRYMPTTHALLVACSRAWLTAEIGVYRGREARWKACDTITKEPTSNVRLPVRHVRVLYALPNRLYDPWLRSVTPAAHEYFCRHSSLRSHTAPGFRAFLNRMLPGTQFYTPPERS